MERPHGIRVDVNGELWIPRPDAKLEAWLDRHHVRKFGDKLQWIDPPGEGETWADDVTVSEIRAHLFGKGPSLERWIDEGEKVPAKRLVVTLNEAALLVPMVRFAFVLDPAVYRLIAPELPERCSPVVPPAQRSEEWTGKAPRIMFRWASRSGGDAGRPRPPQGYATAPGALTILAAWGVREVVMVGFDSIEPSWNRDDDAYPPVVLEAGAPQRAHADYHLINRQIDSAIEAGGLDVEWFHRT